MMRHFSFLGVALILLFGAALARAQLRDEQSAQLAEIKTTIDQAARLFKEGKFAESSRHVAAAQALVEKADASDATSAAVLKVFQGRLAKAHALLSGQGVEMPESATASTSPQAAATAAQRGGATAAGASGAISFTKQVAPILVSRCGGCHVGRSMGEFSMATFAALMQGAEAGAVIEAGNPEESILIHLVENGEMPPPRPRPRPVSRTELQVLKNWVAQGAKFDGSAAAQPLLEMVPPEVARAAAGQGGPGGFGGPGPRGRGPR